MMKYFATLFLSILCLTIVAQKQETVFRATGDSSQNYYIVILPDNSPKGLLVILPGFGNTPKRLLASTNLPIMASKNGYVVIIPLLVSYSKEDTNNIFENELETLIPEVLKKYNIPSGKFIIGGHSLGGQQALYYAEQAVKKNNSNIIKPDLVFGVDPPLDLKRMYESCLWILKSMPNDGKGSEAEFIVNRFNHIYGGSPSEHKKTYELASPYSRNMKDGGNIQYLKNIPVRLYSDPDINVYIEHNTPVECMNLSDISASIVQLRLLGNKDAEYISCLGKGFENGRRSPHSISMLDADEFIIWTNKMLSKE